jgi:hypothetical protein
MVSYPDSGALIEGLLQELTALRAENAALRQEVADLQRRLAKNSSNSSKPPGSDGLAKKPRILGSLRGTPGTRVTRCVRWISRTRSNATRRRSAGIAGRR